MALCISVLLLMMFAIRVVLWNIFCARNRIKMQKLKGKPPFAISFPLSVHKDGAKMKSEKK